MNRLASLLVLLLVSGLLACGAPAEDPMPDRPGEPEGAEPEDEPTAAVDDVVLAEATVRHVEVEGGCWAIESVDGDRYEPLELPEGFRTDGAMVDVVLRPRPDMASTCQVGQVVEIVSIEAPTLDPAEQ